MVLSQSTDCTTGSNHAYSTLLLHKISHRELVTMEGDLWGSVGRLYAIFVVTYLTANVTA